MDVTDGGAAARTVLVADDHPLMLEVLVSVIDACDDLAVVATAVDGPATLGALAEVDPDVAVLDHSMPGCSGVHVASAARHDHPATRVVMLSAFDDAGTVAAALRAGVRAYLPKTVASGELIAAIREVLRGGVVLHPSVAGVAHLLAQGGGVDRARPVLSDRESAVLQLLATGKTNKGIAHELGVSVQTVKTYVERLYTKLGVSSRGEAVRRGFEADLLVS